MKRAVPQHEVEIFMPSGWKSVGEAATAHAALSKAELFAKVPANNGVRTLTRRGGATRITVLRAPSPDMTPALGAEAGLSPQQAKIITLTVIKRVAIASLIAAAGAISIAALLHAAAQLGLCCQ